MEAMEAVVAAAIRTLLLVLLFSASFAARGDAVAVPELRARVTDLAELLTQAQAAALESRLEAFERDKGSQVVVLTVPTTQPETIEQYAIRVVDAWKPGRKEQDDGVLLLVAHRDRALRIEVGRGLEGAIPDAIAKRVIEETIVPRFRSGDFAGGIDAGIDAILGLIRGEALPEPAWKSQSEGGRPANTAAILFAILVIFALMGLGGGRGRGYRSGLAGMGGLGGRSGGGGFSGGGGSFGGGGASGRW